MNMSWLATEAKNIHTIFANSFFVFIGVLLLIGVILEFFKLPLGGTPGFATLVGRAVVAGLLLSAFPEIMNMIADITDSLAKDLGSLNEFHLVLTKLGDKLGSLSFSWVSFKDSVLLLISFLTFFVLYVTVYLAEAMFTYSWLMAYVFSPILIAMFVLPSTASATSGLFRTLIEVSLWKVTWCALAAILWSYALSDINNPEHHIDFLSAIVLNLMLAISILMTPKIVSSFTKGSLSGMASGLGSFALGAIALTPSRIMKSPVTATRPLGRGLSNGFNKKENHQSTNSRRNYRF